MVKPDNMNDNLWIPLGENPPGLLRIFHRLCLAELAEILAHDFNNVLTGMSGYAQMALTTNKPDHLRMAADKCLGATGQLETMIQRFQFFARESLDTFAPVDPAQSAELIRHLMGRHMLKRGLALEVRNLAPQPVVGNTIQLATLCLIPVLAVKDRVGRRNTTGSIHFQAEPSSTPDWIRMRIDVELGPLSGDTAPSPGETMAGPRRAMASLALETIVEGHHGLIPTLPPEPWMSFVVDLPAMGTNHSPTAGPSSDNPPFPR